MPSPAQPRPGGSTKPGAKAPSPKPVAPPSKPATPPTTKPKPAGDEAEGAIQPRRSYSLLDRDRDADQADADYPLADQIQIDDDFLPQPARRPNDGHSDSSILEYLGGSNANDESGIEDDLSAEPPAGDPLQVSGSTSGPVIFDAELAQSEAEQQLVVEEDDAPSRSGLLNFLTNLVHHQHKDEGPKIEKVEVFFEPNGYDGRADSLDASRLERGLKSISIAALVQAADRELKLEGKLIDFARGRTFEKLVIHPMTRDGWRTFANGRTNHVDWVRWRARTDFGKWHLVVYRVTGPR